MGGFFSQIFVLGALFMTITRSVTAQQNTLSDSLNPSSLPDITVLGRNTRNELVSLPEVIGTNIYAGKKSALILMDNVKGNIVTNNMRQVMAKIPGIHIWESDGSGIQIGISARGLSPNRSWEFNVRQNGYDIAADPFGYPEAYYNPQLQAVQRIEVVRGHGALQYGPQFGGMVNYILRNGSEINKPVEMEAQQSVGSNRLVNTYVGLGGETKKTHYFSFFDHRQGAGWRENNRYFTNSGFGSFTYRISEKFSLTTELMYSHIRSQQPGGLTDEQFDRDPRQSLRKRNWMDIQWLTTAWIAQYNYSARGRLNLKLFHVNGNRNSLGFLKAITIRDVPDSQTGQYQNRTLDIDQYRNWGFEGRLLQDFDWGGRKQTFTSGIRFYSGRTSRFRDGLGTSGTGYTKEIVNGKWPRDLDFASGNIAFFAEQLLRAGRHLVLVPGIRYEYLVGQASGISGYGADGSPVLLSQVEKQRGFLLAGLGLEWHLAGGKEIYGNITQAYRPVLFGDLTAPPATDVVDPDLRDANGYNADLGYRGKFKDWLNLDLSFFYMRYNDRIGSLTRQRVDGSIYHFRTNVGNSNSRGLEVLIECKPLRIGSRPGKIFDIHFFSSYAYTKAVYGDFAVSSLNSNGTLQTSNLKGRRVEHSPYHILRTALTLFYKGFSLTGQYSWVSGAFTDANNTFVPTANGQVGWIPAYKVFDLTLVARVQEKYFLKTGINNLFDASYFTRRAGGYPGPGLMPADGRTVFLTLGAKF